MEWIKNNKLSAALLVVVIVLAVVVAWQHYNKQDPVVTTQTIEVPAKPQIVTNTVETVREVAVQSPSTAGAVLQIVERNGKVIAKVGDQEVEVPNQTGKPDVKLGENGELKVTTEQVARIDVTDMANAQGRLIANREIDKMKIDYDQKLKKAQLARSRERTVWIVGTVAVGTYLIHDRSH